MKRYNTFPLKNIHVILKKFINYNYKIKKPHLIVFLSVFILSLCSYFYNKTSIQFNLNNFFEYSLLASLFIVCYLIITILISSVLIKYIK